MSPMADVGGALGIGTPGSPVSPVSPTSPDSPRGFFNFRTKRISKKERRAIDAKQ